jgi:hypothetical protein
VPILGFISNYIYLNAKEKAKKESSVLTPENIVKFSEINLISPSIRHIFGELGQDYVRLNYDLSSFVNGGDINIMFECSLALEKDGFSETLIKSLRANVIDKIVANNGGDVNKKALTNKQEQTKVVKGYSLRNDSKDNCYSDFWHRYGTRIKDIKGVFLDEIGKGGDAARGKTGTTGVRIIAGKGVDIINLRTVLESMVEAYNTSSPSAKKKMRISDLYDANSENVNPTEIIPDQMSKEVREPIYRKKSLLYHGAGHQGFTDYILIHSLMKKAGINVSGIVKEANLRKHNLMLSIKNSYPLEFNGISVIKEGTGTKNDQRIDILHLSYDNIAKFGEGTIRFDIGKLTDFGVVILSREENENNRMRLASINGFIKDELHNAGYKCKIDANKRYVIYSFEKINE